MILVQQLWHYFLSLPLPAEFPGYAPAKLHLFFKDAYVVTKTRNDLERPETI